MTLARKMVLGGLPAAYPGSQLNNGAKAAPASAQALVLAVVRPLSAIECLTLSRGMNEVTPSYCYTGIIIPEDSGAVLCISLHPSGHIWE